MMHEFLVYITHCACVRTSMHACVCECVYTIVYTYIDVYCARTPSNKRGSKSQRHVYAVRRWFDAGRRSGYSKCTSMEIFILANNKIAGGNTHTSVTWSMFVLPMLHWSGCPLHCTSYNIGTRLTTMRRTCVLIVVVPMYLYVYVVYNIVSVDRDTHQNARFRKFPALSQRKI